MTLRALLLLFASLPLFGQTTADSLNTNNIALTTNTVALTVTATQGDQTVCTLNKLNGGAIALAMTCTSGDGKTVMRSGALRATGTAVQTLPFGMSDTFCLLAVNPTAAAVIVGSLGSVPANSVGWSCATNIRTAGAITGQTVPVLGSVSFP